MKVDRLVSIIMILLKQKRMGAQELAEMFEVSPRTIYRDIDAINMAGIPVCSISGVGGGFEIMEQYKVDNKVFSTSDLSAILMGLSSISNMIQGEELGNALAKVKSFIPTEQEKEIEVKTSQINIDLTPWMGNRNIQSNLEKIKTALQENRLLSFEYADRYGNKSMRIAEPYQLVLKSSHWYMQGYCYQREDFRLFKLSRISNMQIQEDIFTPREYQQPRYEMDPLLETMQTKVKIRFHKSVLERVLDYCSKDGISADGEEHYTVEFSFIESEYFYNILFSLGDKCECLEPLHIREEMKRRIHAMAAIYEQPPNLGQSAD